MFKAASPSELLTMNNSMGNGDSSTCPDPSQMSYQTPTSGSIPDNQANESINASNSEIIKGKKLEDIKNQCSELISELDSDDDPEAVVKKHISKLNEYNELKDIALGLVTMIADQRQLRTTDILEEMKLEISDN